jgi:hypothetical protein
MTKEQFEKAEQLHKELKQLNAARRFINDNGLLRNTTSMLGLLYDKKWIDSDKRISAMVVKEMDARLAEIDKEIGML